MQVLLVGALPEYGCVSSKNPDILLHAADNSLRFSAAKICPTDFLVSLGIGDARKAEFGLEQGVQHDDSATSAGNQIGLGRESKLIGHLEYENAEG